jgi:hydroxypyruvate isomerase
MRANRDWSDLWSAHCSLLFGELPFLHRPAAARDAGFRYVESWWIGEAEMIEWADAVRNAGLLVSCLNANAGNIEAGERGFLTRPDRKADVLGDVEAALVLGRRVGARVINVLAGLLDPARPHAAQWADAVATLRECAEMARASGQTLVVEHLNEADVPGYLLPTPRDAARLVESVGSDHVRMLYDVYHAASLDPIPNIRPFADVIGHVQYADYPGRGAPGSGVIDPWRFAEAVIDAGYRGPIGLEYKPPGSTLSSLGVLQVDPPWTFVETMPARGNLPSNTSR